MQFLLETTQMDVLKSYLKAYFRRVSTINGSFMSSTIITYFHSAFSVPIDRTEYEVNA